MLSTCSSCEVMQTALGACRSFWLPAPSCWAGVDNHHAAEGEFKTKRREDEFVQLLPFEKEASCWNTSAKRSDIQMDTTAPRMKSIPSPSHPPCPLSLADLGWAHMAAPHLMGKARDIPTEESSKVQVMAGPSCGQGSGPAHVMVPGLPQCAGDMLCNVCLQCNSPESSHATLFETKEETASLWSQKVYNEFNKTLYFKACSICRSHLPWEKLEHAPLTGVKRVEGNRSRRGCFTSPVPTASKMPLCSAAASILISITMFTFSSWRSLAFEATVQFSSSQHFLVRYAKTSLLVLPNDNYKLSRSSPKPLPFLSPYWGLLISLSPFPCAQFLNCVLNHCPRDSSIQGDKTQHSMQGGAEPRSQVIKESSECIPPVGHSHPPLTETPSSHTRSVACSKDLCFCSKVKKEASWKAQNNSV